MIIRSLDEVVGTDRDVAGDGWRSRRLMLRRDGLGFSLHDTTVAAGADMELPPPPRGLLLPRGGAEVTDLASGAAHVIRPGTVYALDQHDRHRLRVSRDLRLVCVFNPALRGAETHDETGSFPPPDD